MKKLIKWFISLFKRKERRDGNVITTVEPDKIGEQTKEFKPAPKPEQESTELTVAEGNVFSLMDEYDNNIIVGELKGMQVLEKMVYQFTDGSGKKVTNLSKVGVDTACQELARKGIVVRDLECPDPKETDKCYTFKVKAGRYAVNKEGKEVLLDTAFGFKKQDKLMKVYKRDKNGKKTRDFTMETNPFSFEQGGVKASRNAKMRLIPADLIKMLVEDKIKRGNVKSHKVKGEIDETGTIVKTPEKANENPDAKEKTKLFKQIIEAGKMSILNIKLNGRSKDQLSVKELQDILNTPTDDLETHEQLSKEMEKGTTPDLKNMQDLYNFIIDKNKLTQLPFAKFWQKCRVLFPNIDLTKADRKEVMEIAKVLSKKTAGEITNLKEA